MPFCPQCQAEYQQELSSCADCEVELVASLGSSEAADALEPYLLRFEPGPLAETTLELLSRAKVPFREHSEGVEIPSGMARAVLAGLDMFLEFQSEEEGGARVVAVRPQEETPDLEILKRPVGRLLEAFEDSVRELRRIGEKPEWGRAAEAMQCLLALFRAQGADPEERLLMALCEGPACEVFALTRELAEHHSPDLPLRILAGLAELDTEHLIHALHVLGQMPDPRVAPFMMSFLEHDDDRVRAEADEVLCWVSNTDVGFEPEGPENERQEATSRWRAWVESQQLG